MKAYRALLLAVVIAAGPAVVAYADAGKTLQNIRGSVGYGASATNPSHKLAPNASTAISDSDYAVTGPQSIAMIGLPGSSQIEIGSNSSVQMQSFNQADIAHAKFVFVGKCRLHVSDEHRTNRRARYDRRYLCLAAGPASQRV